MTSIDDDDYCGEHYDHWVILEDGVDEFVYCPTHKKTLGYVEHILEWLEHADPLGKLEGVYEDTHYDNVDAVSEKVQERYYDDLKDH